MQRTDECDTGSSRILGKEVSDAAVWATDPLVSVCIISYQQAPYIGRAIEGALAQKTTFPFEIVIGDDASTDGTCRVAQRYQRDYPDKIRVLTSERNRGKHWNYQRTERACRGTYLAYCDADDYWHHPGKLQLQADYLEAHPECGLIDTDGDWFDVTRGTRIKNALAGQRPSSGAAWQLRDVITSDWIMMSCTVMMRRAVLEDVLNSCADDVGGRFPMADLPRFIEVAVRSGIAHINQSTATYCVFPESSCHSRDPVKNLAYYRGGRELRLRAAARWGGTASREWQQRIVARSTLRLLRYACQARRSDVARELLQDAADYEVPVGPVGRLNAYGARCGMGPAVIRALLLQWAKVRRSVRHVAWVRAIKERWGIQ